MSFLGNYLEPRLTEAALSRGLVRFCVQKLFKRPEFPQSVCMALQDSAVVNKNDVVFSSSDCEHPFDFVPMPSFDQLVLNLPTKEQFMAALGIEKLEDATPEAEQQYWDAYDFEFGTVADGVTLNWE